MHTHAHPIVWILSLHCSGIVDCIKGVAGHTKMVEFIWNYFCSDSASPPPGRGENRPGARRVTAAGWGAGFRPPLFLQHSGHSRTVVGIEQSKAAAGGCDVLFELARVFFQAG